MEYGHIPVMPDEAIAGLNIKPDGVYADGTMGGAGHSYAIAKRLSESGRLIGIDRDTAAVEQAMKVLNEFGDKVSFVNSNFVHFKEIMDRLGIAGVDGILLDLGVSSYQLDTPERGFSYNHDAPLDMRMDRRSSLTAFDVVNGYSEKKLAEIIKNYGEERWAKRIAEFIAAERISSPIETTFGLVSAIKRAVPKGARLDGPHPAKRTFQAIRIEVNGELAVLEAAIRDMAETLNPGGRLCVITFHSLEDRIVKNVMKGLENPCTCPAEFPVCICGKKPVLRTVTKRPVQPGRVETEANHRARSAKLRIAERMLNVE